MKAKDLLLTAVSNVIIFLSLISIVLLFFPGFLQEPTLFAKIILGVLSIGIVFLIMFLIHMEIDFDWTPVVVGILYLAILSIKFMLMDR